MYTSSAEPARLESYGTAMQPIADDIATAATKLDTALEGFRTGAGDFAPSTSTASSWSAPLRTLHDELAYLGAWTTRVGGWFRDAADDPDGDGVYGTDDELALALGSPILAVERRRVAAELASLHERARRGDLDLGPNEVAALVERARTLVDAAADPQAEAQLLTAAMGPGDVVTALTVLESVDLDDPSSLATSIAAMRDLGRVVSLGLEDQPARAERWADEIVTLKLDAGPIWGTGAATESIAVMGSGNAAGTSVLTGALFGQLITRTGRTPRGGIVDRAYGVTDPAAPILATAATVDDGGLHPQARLAHDVVRRSLDAGHDTMADVFDDDDGAQPLDPVAHGEYQTRLGEVLAASVDYTLPAEARRRLADDLATYYVTDQRLLPQDFSAPVTRGFGAATQPLLEAWTGSTAGAITLTEASGPAPDDVLWDAARALAGEPGGSAGLNAAIEGTTTVRLGGLVDPTLARSNGDYGPYHGDDLRELGEVYWRLATEVGNERFNSIVDALETDTRVQDATMAVVTGIAGELPGGSTAAGITEALVTYSTGPPGVTGGGNPIDGLAAHLSRDLVIHNVETVPELQSDTQLRTVIEEVCRTRGQVGLHDLVHGSEHELDDVAGPGLDRLRALIDAQESNVNLPLAEAIGDLTESDQDGG